MPSDDVARLGVREAGRRIREGTLSPVDLIEGCLARIRAIEDRVKAWVTVDEAGARAAARQREAEAREGRRGALQGIPVGIKDIIDVAGLPTTAGARPWAHRRPPADATVVARLRMAGAVILGKTATTEFAYRDPAPTRNPWNLDHTPGGSSSGSGAAVGARMVPLALGTQTVGSVLRPAAYCGAIGVKATHGLVPADGVVPLAWSLDHVGVFARSVADAALILGVAAGRSFEAVPARPPRLGLVPELLARCESEMAAHIQGIVDRLARAGATIVEVKLPPSFAGLHDAGLAVLEAEAAAYHQESHKTHAAEYGKDIRALIESGLGQPAPRYVRANRARLAFRADVMTLLAEIGTLLVPTVPAPAPAGLAWTGDASLCAPWSYTGVPAITLPSGLGGGGLPLAVQLVAAAAQEQHLLDVAQWCEDVIAFTVAPSI